MVHPVKNFETWYEATTSRGEAHESLRSRISVDACVIGGGLAGISTARELQRRGLQVVLLEANRLAWGASGRNGGFVSSGFATDISEVATQHGLETARRLYRLSHMGVTHIANEISMHDPSIRMGDGVIVAWRYPNRDEVQKHIAKMAHDYGHQLSSSAASRCDCCAEASVILPVFATTKRFTFIPCAMRCCKLRGRQAPA